MAEVDGHLLNTPSLEALEDWEDWDPSGGTSFFVHAAAGSLAGAAEHCAMFPFDTIKTFSQAATKKSSKTFTSLFVTNNQQVINNTPRQIPKLNILRLWRGVSTMLTACIPAHAAYFSIFEHSRETLHIKYPGDSHESLTDAASGMIATVAHDLIMTPMDVVKQRLQLGFHSGVLDCMKSVVKTEGGSALFRSLPVTLCMNIPYAAVMVSTNERAKRILNPNKEYNIKAFLMSGVLAGSVAAIVTNPLDVVKTRLQTQTLLESYPNCSNLIKSPAKALYKPKGKSFLRGVNMFGGGVIKDVAYGVGVRGTYTLESENTKRLECVCKDNVEVKREVRYKGFIQTVGRIYAEEGARGFMRGAASRVMVHAPSVALSWTTYESAKKLLKSFSY